MRSRASCGSNIELDKLVPDIGVGVFGRCFVEFLLTVAFAQLLTLMLRGLLPRISSLSILLQSLIETKEAKKDIATLGVRGLISRGQIFYLVCFQTSAS